MKRITIIALVALTVLLFGYMASMVKASVRQSLFTRFQKRRQQVIDSAYDNCNYALGKIENIVREMAEDRDQLNDMLVYVAMAKMSVVMYKQTGNNVHVDTAKTHIADMMRKYAVEPS